METLRQKQSRFTRYVASLIVWAFDHGYELTFGEVQRDARIAIENAKSGAGISNSLHLVSLAVDLHLFVAGRYATDTESYRPLGEYWKSLAPDCRWGGDFKSRPDGNHLSIEHGGRA
jgi:hypothetical protein